MSPCYAQRLVMQSRLNLLLLWLSFASMGESQESSLHGRVRGINGEPILSAVIDVRSISGIALERILTDANGGFHSKSVASGYVQLRIASEGLATREIVHYAGERSEPIDIILEPESVYTRITVNATRGAAEEASDSSHVAIIKDFVDILKRPVATIGNVFEQEPGILVQQSTYAQVSPFLRGLTGYQVLNLIDGIRFNNSTFRSGPNQYLALIEPMQANRIEALLGPTGSQYGSDSLGGTIQVMTREARFAEPRRWETHGDLSLTAASADLSGQSAGRISLANDKVFMLLGASGRRHNDLRGGQGFDSRNVYHRLFGLPLESVHDLLGGRQQDTGFRQYGVQAKFAVRITASQLLTVYYQRGVQDQVRGYKDLLGGLGRVRSTFEPQVLNWTYARYEKTNLGFLDALSGTFSLNQQIDGGSRQNLRFSDPITTDYNRVNSYGYTSQATTHWGPRLLASFGGDIYDERVYSTRSVLNPVTGGVTSPRPLYPNDSSYRSLGAFGQSSFDITGALRVAGGIRVTGVNFKTRADRVFGIPDSSQWFDDVTFNSSIRWQANQFLGFHAVVSRGFRAPNLNDLGALGLNDLGYEIPISDAISSGALLSTDAGESATSKGSLARALSAESLMNYEAGVRVNTGRLYARVQFFNANLQSPIVRRTLLFSADAVPVQLAGIPVSALPQTPAQGSQGVVTVATQFDPRSVKSFVNDGRSRYYGFETFGRYRISGHWAAQANYSYILGRELDPNRNVRRLPPVMGSATLRYTPSRRRAWFEVSLAAAGEQSRLSGGDIDDERIGGSYRRRDIADFFQGSLVSPYISNGVFGPTGETLTEIQNRVAPIGSVINGVRVVDDSSRVPLYLSTGRWITLNVRSGIPVGERWSVLAAIENLLDRNYRFHGSGVDAPGVSAYVGLTFRF